MRTSIRKISNNKNICSLTIQNIQQGVCSASARTFIKFSKNSNNFHISAQTFVPEDTESGVKKVSLASLANYTYVPQLSKT